MASGYGRSPPTTTVEKSLQPGIDLRFIILLENFALNFFFVQLFIFLLKSINYILILSNFTLPKRLGALQLAPQILNVRPNVETKNIKMNFASKLSLDIKAHSLRAGLSPHKSQKPSKTGDTRKGLNAAERRYSNHQIK